MAEQEHIPLDLAYAAGIIDGEGWVGMNYLPAEHASLKGKRRSPMFRCCVEVIMVDPRIPMWLCERFGGSVRSYASRKPGHRGTHKWTLQHRQAEAFCRLIAPYLMLKREQAEIIVSYYSDPRFSFTRRSKGIPAEEVEARMEYVARSKSLNRRGGDV